MKTSQHKRSFFYGLALATIFPVLGSYIYVGILPNSLDALQAIAIFLGVTLVGVVALGLPIVLLLRSSGCLTWGFVLISSIVLGNLYFQILGIFLLSRFEVQHLVWGTGLGLLAGFGFCIGAGPNKSFKPNPLRGSA